MIMMGWWHYRQKLRIQQHSLSTRRARLRERNNKKHEHLLWKCLNKMGMPHLIKRFKNFNQFIRMSSDKCLVYGPRFVVEYDKLHARIEALCTSTFSVVEYFGPYDALGVYNEATAWPSAPSAASSVASTAATVPGVATSQGKNPSDDAKEAKGAAEKEREEEEEEEEEEEGDEDLRLSYQHGQEVRKNYLMSTQRKHDHHRARNNKKHDPLLCKFLVAMRLEHFVDHFDTFNQFIRMSSDQCLRYGPEFVTKYEKLHARLQALCSSAFSLLRYFGPDYAGPGSPAKGYYEAIASAASSVASTAAAVATSHGKNLLDEAEEAKGAAEKEKGEIGEEKEEEEEQEEEEFWENAQRY